MRILVQDDIKFMRLALRQARRGVGATSPNPRVGAVLVRDGQVVSQGYHRAFGELHAEADCLRKVSSEAADNTTLYVNLEPCCHQGKTPPCTHSIIQAGIKRVVYGMHDPNPLVNGKGLEHLMQAGVEVSGSTLEAESFELNRGYVKYRHTGHPWVTLKWAQSLDGRIAAGTGDCRWISSPDSLNLAHRLRAEHDAILVGVNTVLTDDPRLNVRHARGRDPVRVILDSSLEMPSSAAIFSSGDSPIIVVTCQDSSPDRIQLLRDKGAEILTLPCDTPGQMDLKPLLSELGRRGILYLLVEGGAATHRSFIRQKLYDEIVAIIAPTLIGSDGISSVGPLGVQKVNDAVKLCVAQSKNFGRDTVLWLRPESQRLTTND